DAVRGQLSRSAFPVYLSHSGQPGEQDAGLLDFLAHWRVTRSLVPEPAAVRRALQPGPAAVAGLQYGDVGGLRSHAGPPPAGASGVEPWRCQSLPQSTGLWGEGRYRAVRA